MALTLSENDSGVSGFSSKDNKSSIHRLSSNRPSNEMATSTTTAASSITGDTATANRKSVSSQRDHQPPTLPLHSRSESIDLELERGLKLDDLRDRRAQELAPPTSAHTNPSRDGESSMHTEGSSAWDPSHPCYPHVNPHVGPNSPLAETTRIIRIPRDFMIHGDTSPAFSNTYPKILEPYLSEDRFRHIVKTINSELYEAFNPWNWRNWVDASLGVLTLWFAEDILGTETKRRLKRIEAFIEQQNREMEEILERLRKGEIVDEEIGRTESREGEGGVPISGLAKLIPLRRTGYMNLDIQIPNPFTPDSEFGDDEMADYSAQPTPRETGAPASPHDQTR
ncbi:Ras modification protein erf4 [Drechslerella dactyloides]|uniref:Ras modification protein ERF4 n=1 Tax=Drechslerella dactyloides TaxID=74499 RepID=A0AAD6J635_DREDA|nr:Ras modification protein erf4 [Drechslerella dactyloides]